MSIVVVTDGGAVRETPVMVERPADIRIDDLNEPRYSDDIAAAFELVAPMADAIPWTAEGLLAQAAEETGLDDFGAGDFEEPMGVLVGAMAAEGALSSLGRFSHWSTLVGLARNRALITDLLKRHPEIHDVEITAPIVIAGQGRTGTTHMHNLMSADPSLRTLPYWESVEPVPPLAEQGQTFEVDPRYTRTEESLAGLNVTLPHFRRMHDMYADHVHEEIQLLAIGFSTMLFETMAIMPSWKAWYVAHDQTPFYEYMKTILKALSWLRPAGDRWLLKSPQHVEQYAALMNVFPDAVVVRTHRDPAAIAGSMATMVQYTGRMSREPDRVHEIGPYWVGRLTEMCQAAADQRDLVPADRVIDVRFDDFMVDDVAMIERIYEVADQPFTAAVRANMERFMVDHPRGKYGRVAYDLADFGSSAEAVRAACSDYRDAFGV
ncbi:MAG: sulfotransferase [Acidimicrobiales bacterium]|nr:sulfotransferase [Acidimicrobiales bacterium]